MKTVCYFRFLQPHNLWFMNYSSRATSLKTETGFDLLPSQTFRYVPNCMRCRMYCSWASSELYRHLKYFWAEATRWYTTCIFLYFDCQIYIWPILAFPWDFWVAVQRKCLGGFFCGPDRYWNAFDCAIVGLSVFELVVEITMSIAFTAPGFPS